MYGLYFTEGFPKCFYPIVHEKQSMIIPQQGSVILICIYIGIDMIQADFLFHILGVVISNNNIKEIITIYSSFYS